MIDVEHKAMAVAYPFYVLRKEPVIDDVVDGLPVLGVLFAEGETGLVYDW